MIKNRSKMSKEGIEMLTDERYMKILSMVQQNGTVSVTEISRQLGVSESTVRRDLLALDDMKKLKKIHGGASSISGSILYEENDVGVKQLRNADAKERIGIYAADTIMKGDFVFIDAGTTTENMIDHITQKDAVYVTNGFSHARALARKGLNVFILGGRLKSATEAIVGTEAVTALSKYNFTKCYLGANGVSADAGFTTPDTEEAAIKSAASKNSYVTYVLADSSKFGCIYAVTFSKLEDTVIITDKDPGKEYSGKALIKEA